ncbi:MAG: HAD family hydrolase [Bacteroidales bacterium]|nr:HAD family hydrolase [Bacteroidales bacterium]
MVLYACDLDGTLLDADARLSAETARMFRQLSSEGAKITFVTARTPATVQPIMEPAQPQLSGVVMTGAALWNPARKVYESVVYHRPDDVRVIADICRRHSISPFVYTMTPGSNSLLVYHNAPKLTPIEQHFAEDRTLNELKTFSLGQEAPEYTEQCTVLFFAMGDKDKIQAAAEAITQATTCYASWYPDTYNPGITLLEVFAPGVSKAAGLLKLKALLQADKVVAFGDNLNDIPMLQAADLSIAVENAHPEVKAIAHLVIGPNTADSVIKWIEQDYKSAPLTP